MTSQTFQLQVHSSLKKYNILKKKQVKCTEVYYCQVQLFLFCHFVIFLECYVVIKSQNKMSGYVATKHFIVRHSVILTT